MNRTVILWIFSLIITLISAIYQQKTGPTYPVNGGFTIGEASGQYKFERSHSGADEHKVAVIVSSNLIIGTLKYKRYKTVDEWTEIPMRRDSDTLCAFLPHQPPAGKIIYRVTLSTGNQRIELPEREPVLIRFRGDVPAAVLYPHIIFMFAAMLFSTRAGFEALFKRNNLVALTWWTAGLLFAGGIILGPIMQKYAFGELWTGAPFGWDLTDNKTLIGMVGWIMALIAVHRKKGSRGWTLFAAVLMLVIYLIPHSMFGSELDYGKIEQGGI